MFNASELLNVYDQGNERLGEFAYLGFSQKEAPRALRSVLCAGCLYEQEPE